MPAIPSDKSALCSLVSLLLSGITGNSGRRGKCQGGRDQEQDRVAGDMRGEREQVGDSEAQVGQCVIGSGQTGDLALVNNALDFR